MARVLLNAIPKSSAAQEKTDGMCLKQTKEWRRAFKKESSWKWGILSILIQAHPTPNEISDAAAVIKKSKSSAAVMLLNSNKPFAKFGHEILNLPEFELRNAFAVALLAFSMADNRRKTEEDPSFCTHWWHKDLSNKQYIRYLLKKRL